MKISHLLLAASVGISLTACETLPSSTSSANMDKTETHTGKSNKQARTHKKGEKRNYSNKGGGHGKNSFYDTYDADDNKSVSIAEYTKQRNKGYAVRDLNNDGKVLADEYVAEYEARLEQDLAAQRDRQLKQAYVRFNVLDTDKNGIISREEFQTSGKRMFDRLDTNKDSIVDASDTATKY